MIINYYYYWGGGAGRGIRLKDVGKKKKGVLRGKKFIYYNNLYRVICKNPIRKVKPNKIKINLIIKGNSNR